MTRRGLLSLALSPVSYEVETIESPRQATATFLRVARPRGKSNRTVLILPVTANISGQWGDGFYEAIKLNWVKRYNITIAAPSFSHLPWYADHPTNLKIAQESYILQDILPRFSGRILLLGFSKSGNGALTLMLRNPGKFAAAAAWARPTLLEKHFRDPMKIAISGHGSFQSELAGAHEKMIALGIQHEYDNATKRPRHWFSGWMEPAMATLDRLTR